jgi:hypothetical protein
MASDRMRRKSQEHEGWDTEEGTLHPAVGSPGAVVSVRITSEEFQRLSRAARRTGMRTTQFIHAAALAQAGEELPMSSKGRA